MYNCDVQLYLKIRAVRSVLIKILYIDYAINNLLVCNNAIRITIVLYCIWNLFTVCVSLCERIKWLSRERAVMNISPSDMLTKYI